MKMLKFFSGRPFSILLLSFSFLIVHAASAQDAPPVRYGNGGFAPTDLSSSSSRDDMSGGITATPLSPSTSNSYQADVESRLNALETQMRDLRGQLEEKDHEIQQLKTQLDKSTSDMQMQMGNNTGGAKGTSGDSAIPPQPNNSSSGNLTSGDVSDSSSPPQPSAPSDPKAPASASSPTVKNLGSVNQSPNGVPIAPSGNDVAGQYESAFTKLKNGDYASAQTEFSQFLKANPDNQLASNATYWYGETFYAQQKYTDAARIFAESYKKYPKSPKAADSLLKLGMSLGGAGKSKEACVALKQLKKQFPTGNAATLKRADSEMSKLACS